MGTVSSPECIASSNLMVSRICVWFLFPTSPFSFFYFLILAHYSFNYLLLLQLQKRHTWSHVYNVQLFKKIFRNKFIVSQSHFCVFRWNWFDSSRRIYKTPYPFLIYCSSLFFEKHPWWLVGLGRGRYMRNLMTTISISLSRIHSKKIAKDEGIHLCLFESFWRKSQKRFFDVCAHFRQIVKSRDLADSNRSNSCKSIDCIHDIFIYFAEIKRITKVLTKRNVECFQWFLSFFLSFLSHHCILPTSCVFGKTKQNKKTQTGCVRVVHYTADAMGFHPTVTYEGDCQQPGGSINTAAVISSDSTQQPSLKDVSAPIVNPLSSSSSSSAFLSRPVLSAVPGLINPLTTDVRDSTQEAFVSRPSSSQQQQIQTVSQNEDSTDAVTS